MKPKSKTVCKLISASISVALLLLFSLTSNAETDLTGKQLYKQCSACHLASGAGVPGMFPPLINRLGPLADSKAGREYLVMVIQAGLMGRLSIEGNIYQGMMPAQGASLGDDGIASVLNYLLKTFNTESLNHKAKVFTTEEVAIIKDLYPGVIGRDIYTLRQAAFTAINQGDK